MSKSPIKQEMEWLDKVWRLLKNYHTWHGSELAVYNAFMRYFRLECDYHRTEEHLQPWQWCLEVEPWDYMVGMEDTPYFWLLLSQEEEKLLKGLTNQQKYDLIET